MGRSVQDGTDKHLFYIKRYTIAALKIQAFLFTAICAEVQASIKTICAEFIELRSKSWVYSGPLTFLTDATVVSHLQPHYIVSFWQEMFLANEHSNAFRTYVRGVVREMYEGSR